MMQTLSYEERKQRILTDLAASFWLREAVQSLERRDCVDAWHDAQTLTSLCEARMKSVLARGEEEEEGNPS